MPTDHAEVVLSDVRVAHVAILGEEGHGLAAALLFVHENRIRQAASSLGAAQFCVDRSVDYARERVTFGKPLAVNQAIQWPLVELHTDCAMLRGLVRETARRWTSTAAAAVTDRISMCNYRANRLACDAADRAIQVHGGIGYTRAHAVRAHLPPPPPLPDHRGLRGDAAAQRRAAAVRVRRAELADRPFKDGSPLSYRRAASLALICPIVDGPQLP